MDDVIVVYDISPRARANELSLQAADCTTTGNGLIMGSTGSFWKNIKPGLSLVMKNEYTTLNGKQAFETQIYIVRNDVKTNNKSQTLLNRILAFSK